MLLVILDPVNKKHRIINKHIIDNIFIVLYFFIYGLYFNIIIKATAILILPTKNVVVMKPSFGNNINGNTIEPISPPI